MKITLLILCIFLFQGTAYSQNYRLIEKQNRTDTAYIDTIKMSVYVITDKPRNYNLYRNYVIPKYFIPVSHINDEFTIGDYLKKINHRELKDSMIFFVNFLDYTSSNRSYYEYVTLDPQYEFLNSFLNDTTILTFLPEDSNYYKVKRVKYFDFNLFVMDAMWIRVVLPPPNLMYKKLNYITHDMSLKSTTLYFLNEIIAIAPVIKIKNQGIQKL